MSNFRHVDIKFLNKQDFFAFIDTSNVINKKLIQYNIIFYVFALDFFYEI